MDKLDFLCFSCDKYHLKTLDAALKDYFGTSASYTYFQKTELFLYFLSVNKTLIPRLIILDTSGSDLPITEFFACINQNLPYSVKIVISEERQLPKILEKLDSVESMFFLKHPWTKSDLHFKLKLAEKELYRLGNKLVNPPLMFDQKLDDKLQELIDANIAKDRIMSVLAHDLKSPFAALIGLSEILTDNWEELDEKVKYNLVNDIRKTSINTFKLLEDILKWSKSQREKIELCIEEINIRGLVESTIQLAEFNAAPKGIKMENKIDQDLRINADENMIGSVLRNLISNAVKHTPTGGYVEISAREDKDVCVFCVADNGVGIDKPHLLEAFRQGSAKEIIGNTKSFKGMGLILCKDFVERNGGQIWLETQKNVGSKFYFTVPRA